MGSDGVCEVMGVESLIVDQHRVQCIINICVFNTTLTTQAGSVSPTHRLPEAAYYILVSLGVGLRHSARAQTSQPYHTRA